MSIKRIIAATAACVLVLSLAACGGSKSGEAAAADGAATISTADQQKVIDKLAKDAEAVPEPDKKAVAATDSTKATGSSAVTSEDRLLGDWNDISDLSRFVKLTKNGSEYTYQDNDGSYKGTYKDGVLTITLSSAANDTAKVYIDDKTGNLITNYQGDIYTFTKKN